MSRGTSELNGDYGTATSYDRRVNSDRLKIWCWVGFVTLPNPFPHGGVDLASGVRVRTGLPASNPALSAIQDDNAYSAFHCLKFAITFTGTVNIQHYQRDSAQESGLQHARLQMNRSFLTTRLDLP